MAQIFVFGDSITYGVWDEAGGWVNRLRMYIDQKNWVGDEVHVYNLGISGNTSEDLVKRFKSDIKPRLEPPTIFIFAIGINDSYFLLKEKRINVSEEKFKTNLAKLIKYARKHSNKVVFVGLNPVEEEKINPIPWSTSEAYLIENVKKHNGIIEAVCKEKNIDFIPIYNEWCKGDFKKYLADGLHPNSLGHKKIFETVKDFLVNKKLV